MTVIFFLSSSPKFIADQKSQQIEGKMKPKQIPFRAVGQRTIDSSFLNSSSNPFKVSKNGSGNKASEKGSPLSLSDFLEKKLNGTCGLTRTVKGKSKPFSSVVGLRELSGSIENKGNEPSLNSDIEKVVLQQFKPIDCCVAKEDCVDSNGCSIGHEGANSSNSLVVEGTRKRILEGESERQVPRKHFAVLGGDIKKRTQQRRDKNSSKDDEIPSYNHYANGGGFWDSDMEGIDNEEVGFSEVWEGVGSTTFGGIVDWH